MTAPGGGDLRTVIRESWVEVLAHEDFADDESFFEVGGHSLRGILLMKRLEERLRVALPVSLLFDHQSVAAQAEAVGREVQGAADAAPTPSS